MPNEPIEPVENIYPNPHPLPVPEKRKQSKKYKERLRALELVSARVPPRLARKVEWFAMKMSQTMGYKITMEEVINLALAKFTQSEHYLPEYYEKRRLAAPKFVKRQIKVRQNIMDKLIDKYAETGE